MGSKLYTEKLFQRILSLTVKLQKLKTSARKLFKKLITHFRYTENSVYNDGVFSNKLFFFQIIADYGWLLRAPAKNVTK